MLQDPHKIAAYFRSAPETHPCKLTSRGEGRLYPVHMHNAYPDRDGNGVTSISVSHFHRILNGQILPDASDGHVHGLTNVLCGAGI